MTHRPVCVKCECELRPETCGVGTLDMFNPSDKPEPQPYQMWDSDLYKCPKCGYEIMAGFGDNPIAHHWEENNILKRSIGMYEEATRVVRNYSC